MSAVGAEVHNALGPLLSALSSPDNAIRTQAEDQLNNDWVAQRPEVLLMGLVEQMQESDNQTTRSFAAVLFRRIAAKPKKTATSAEPRELFLTLSPAQKEAIQVKLLQILPNESVAGVRHKIGYAVAEVARQYCDEEQAWPELLGVLFHASQSADAGQREVAFRVFATTPGIIQRQHEDAVQNVFAKGFKDAEVDVRISAIQAFTAFFAAIEKKSQKKFYGAVGDILNVLPPLKESGDNENLSRGLIALIDLAQRAPIMFKTMFHSLVQFTVTVIQDKELDDQSRQNGLELMATFADYAPSMCKKDPSYAQEMVTQCLSLMTDVGLDDDDASAWNESQDIDDESDNNHVAGEQCIDRIAQKLGGSVILPPTFGWLPRMVNSTSWRDRHAALMAISSISEGCRDLMMGELDQVLELVIPALKDSHPRVRWAGCNALGQMSTDFAPIMEQKYHHIVLTNIIPVLESPEPRVQSHAAAALVNFSEEAERAVLEPYLDQLLSHLLNLLQSPKEYAQEQALSTIATIADAAETTFGNYYDGLMPLLFGVLRQENTKEQRLLRGKAMECASLISQAVGKERMGQDALVFMELLGSIQSSITESDDPQTTYIIHCYGRMCRALGRDFVTYLSRILPSVLQVASSNADITVADVGQEEELEQDGWETLEVRGKIIAIKTNLLEEKVQAISVISIFAQVLEEEFAPYVTDVLKTVVIPGLSFFINDSVRSESAQIVPYLINSFKKAHGDRSSELATLWETAFDAVMEVLSNGQPVYIQSDLYQCLYESIEVLGKDCLSAKHMATFIDAVKNTIEEYQSRLTARLEDRQDDEDGEEETDELLEEIEEDRIMLGDVNKAFHTIFKSQGISFLPAWSRLLPVYESFASGKDASQRQWATCIFDDVLEFSGEQSWTYQMQIRPPITNGLQDQDPAIRQAACYGIGVAAQKGGQPWSAFTVESLPGLFQVCSATNRDDEEQLLAAENGCAAIAKILQSHQDKVPNFQEVVAHWITTLPIIYDDEAAPYAYMYLTTLIEQQNPAVPGAAAKIFTDMCQALGAESLQGQTAQRIAAAAKSLAQSAGIDAEGLLSTLIPERQRTVRAFFA